MEWKKLSPHLRHLSQADQDVIREAYDVGLEAHGDQKRKSGEPYFMHPVAVASILADMGADRDTLVAALLHDTIEDTPLTLEEVGKQFDGAVRELIDGVTKLEAEDLADKPTLDEKTETLRKIFLLMQRDVRIMVIKLVDRLHNMQTASFLPEAKRKALAEETMDTYVKIADRLSMQDLRDAMTHACLAVLKPEFLEKLEALRLRNERKGHTVIQSMKSAFKKARAVNCDIQYEVKSWEKLQAQLEAEDASVTGLSELTAVFVCPAVEECYQVLGTLHQLWRREALSFQDFINSPAINGYKGLHTTIIMEDGTRIRCKIRTRDMHEYARKGIATVCFDSEAVGILEYLPWTQRIQPLSEDTAYRSEDFWDSLQSDILGESILVHGTGGHTMLLPEGSTALDGAFYCFQEKALLAKSLKVNGREVPFSTVLEHGVSLDMEMGQRSSVSREWLQWVHTGLAMAKIRETLAKQSERKKFALGKELLQEFMNNRRKGFIEEFERKTLARRLQSIGYDSMEQAYVAIADGRLHVTDVYDALFEPKKDDKDTDRFPRSVVHFSFLQSGDIRGSQQMLKLCGKYGVPIQKIRIDWLTKNEETKITLVTRLSQKKLDGLRQDITSLGGRNIEIITRTRQELALLGIVIFLWALNPVIAKWILLQGMTPFALATLRLLVFGIFSILFFAAWRLFSAERYTPISNRAKLALFPSLGNAAMSVYYFALALIPPSIHLTVLRFNTLLLPSGVRRGKDQSIIPLKLFFPLIGFSVLFFALYLGRPTNIGLVFSLATLLFYTLYSVSTERVLHEHKIDVRYPFLLLQMGIYSAIFGILLLPWQAWSHLFNALTIPAVIYILFCVCISHACYSALLKTAQFKHISDIFLLEIPMSIVLEIVILGIILSPIAYFAIGIIIMLLVLSRWRAMYSHVH